jgi:CheY-like chemotaxis protein
MFIPLTQAIIAFFDSRLLQLPAQVTFVPMDATNELAMKNQIMEHHTVILMSATSQNNDYAGFDLARKFRFLGVRLPIFICSPKPRETFVDFYKLLSMRGCYFLQLKGLIKLPDKVDLTPLSALYLADVLQFKLNLFGILDEILHNVKAILRSEVPQLTEGCDIQDLRSCYKQTIPMAMEQLSKELTTFKIQIDPAIHTALEEALQTCHQQFTGKELIKRRSHILDNFNYQVAQQNHWEIPEGVLTGMSPKIAWKILYVEDSEIDQRFLKNCLKQYNISLITVSNAEDAFQQIEQDKNIVMVIVDWRLLNADGSWQALQGYDILEKMKEKNNSIAVCWVLTDKRGVILRASQYSFAFPVQFYLKTVLQLSPDAFAQQVFFTGETAYAQVQGLNMPCFNHAAPEKYSFRTVYWHFLNKHDYNDIHQKIEKIAYLKYVQSILVDQDCDHYKIQLEQYIKRIPFQLGIKLGGIRTHFNSKMDLEEHLPRLYARLVGRLQYLALTQKCLMEKESVCEFIFGIHNEANYQNYLSTFLLITEKHHLLYAEKGWLSTLKRDPDAKKLVQLLRESKGNLKSFFQASQQVSFI